MEEVCGDPLGFLREIVLVAPCFVKSADGFVHFFMTDRAAGFESVSCGEFATRYLLGRDKISKKDMTVCESLFDDESIRGMIVERIA